MKVKKVSVCIPVYGSEPYLETCIESVKTQTFTDYEIIVVNDGSTGVDKQGNWKLGGLLFMRLKGSIFLILVVMINCLLMLWKCCIMRR